MLDSLKLPADGQLAMFASTSCSGSTGQWWKSWTRTLDCIVDGEEVSCSDGCSVETDVTKIIVDVIGLASLVYRLAVRSKEKYWKGHSRIGEYYRSLGRVGQRCAQESHSRRH